MLKVLRVFPVSEAVVHSKGNVPCWRQEMQYIRNIAHTMPFVFRTDIRGYYSSIPKVPLYDYLCSFGLSLTVERLLSAFIFYQVDLCSGKGIPRSSSLSPLIAGTQFYKLDEYLKHECRVVYHRYMDDFLVLSNSRYKLRKAVSMIKRELSMWSFELAKEKTFLGKTERGFDWMGVWFDGDNWSGPSKRSQERSRIKLLTLRNNYGPNSNRLEQYRIGYYRWLNMIERFNTFT